MLGIKQCPDAGQLNRFSLGELSLPEMEALIEHLEACPTCLARLPTLSANDTLVDSLAKADTLADAPDDPVLTRLVDRLVKLGSKSMTPANQDSPKSEKTVGPDTKSAVGGPSASSDDTLAFPPTTSWEGGTLLRPPQRPDELGRLGQYRILEKLGAGGMGVVFLAEDTMLHRRVALKTMLPPFAANPQARERFLREARSTASIEHDHIVPIFQVGEDNNIPYLAMPLLKGEALNTYLKRVEKTPVSEALRIAAEMAEGLAAAHAHGLIHRDIKPDNVWLEASPGRTSGEMRVKLLDFGLARSQAENVRLTHSGLLVGTPAFMAPEQARGDAIDGRADLFSLGCVLYVMLTGERPFKGEDALSVLTSLAVGTPQLPTTINQEVPEAVSEITMRLLEKDPEKRPATAQEVAETLHELRAKLARSEEARDKTETLCRPGVTTMIAPQPQPAPARRRRTPVLVGILLLLAGLIGAALWGAGLIRFQTEQGDLVLQSVDPDFAFSPVKDGAVTLEDRKTKRTYQLKVVPLGGEKYQLEVLDKDADLSFNTEKFTIKRGDKVALSAWFERKGAVAVQPPVGVPPPDAPATEEQIAVAKWILSKKGSVYIRKDGTDYQVRGDKMFPPGPFTIVGASLGRTKGQDFADAITDADMPRLAKLVDLERLYLPGQTVTAKGFAHMAACKKIKSLNFGSSQIDAKAALPIVAQFKELEEYNIQHVVPDEYAELLATLPNVKRVSIWSSGPSPKALARLVQAPKLEYLNIGNTGMTDADLKILLAAKNLHELVLENPGQTPAGVQEFQKAMPQCKIIFNRQPLPPAVATGPDPKSVAAQLAAAQWALEQGCIVTVRRDGKELLIQRAGVGRALEDFPPAPFTVVRLSMTPTNNPDQKKIADADLARIAVLGDLEDLTLSGQPITEAGLAHLRPLVKLKRLTLQNIPARPEESAQTVRGFSRLEYLFAESPWIAALEGMPSLRMFDLNRAVLDASSLGRLKHYPNLSCVVICDSHPIEKDLSLVKDVKTLRLLLLRNENFGDDVLERLAKEMPQCEIRKTSFQNDQMRVWNAGKGKEYYALARVHYPFGWVEEDWLKATAALPADKQVQAVIAKLKERNPPWDGKLSRPAKIEKGVVTALEFMPADIDDITPLRALPGLRHLKCWMPRLKGLWPLTGLKLTELNCSNTLITDLSPLEGMPLTWLWCVNTQVSNLSPLKDMPLTELNCSKTPISDLSPLKGMKLTSLSCDGTKVADLSPLKGMPLTHLHCKSTQVTDLAPLKDLPLKDLSCDFNLERDAAILRSITTLTQINGKPAAHFWKEVDAAAKKKN